jgi:hypothetical protein
MIGIGVCHTCEGCKENTAELPEGKLPVVLYWPIWPNDFSLLFLGFLKLLVRINIYMIHLLDIYIFLPAFSFFVGGGGTGVFFELSASHLLSSHSNTRPTLPVLFVLGIFEIGFCNLFARGWL